MTGYEMHVLAAKAAGIATARIDVCQRENGPNPYIEPWKPRTDDGDAFRLMVKLAMEVRCPGHRVPPIVWQYDYGIRIEVAQGTADPSAAVREAVFQAAVAIGKAMP